MFGYARFAHFDRLSERSDQSDKKLEDSDELNSANKRFEVGKSAGLVSVVEPTGFTIKKLGEVATLTRGVRVTRSILDDKETIPVYQNALTPLGYFNKSNRKKDTTFIISAGAAGQIGYSAVDFWAADDCFTFDNLKGVLSKYIFYFLQTKQSFIDSRVRRGSIPRISRKIFEEITIPLPPLSEQERIVKILDRFDALCNDISAGLPAEIESRKKQYEYYRDKLLSFRPLRQAQCPHFDMVLERSQKTMTAFRPCS